MDFEVCCHHEVQPARLAVTHARDAVTAGLLEHEDAEDQLACQLVPHVDLLVAERNEGLQGRTVDAAQNLVLVLLVVADLRGAEVNLGIPVFGLLEDDLGLDELCLFGEDEFLHLLNFLACESLHLILILLNSKLTL